MQSYARIGMRRIPLYGLQFTYLIDFNNLKVISDVKTGVPQGNSWSSSFLNLYKYFMSILLF